MKAKRNLIQICLLCALMLSAVVQAQDYIYTTNSDGTLTITGYIGSGGAVFIPGTINDLPVTSIGDWAFYSTDVTNVTIPDSVTKIGDGAFFDCESLTVVTIGNSVTDIGDWAFAFCSSLTSVNFRGDTPSLGGADVFYGNVATVYYLPGFTNWGPTFDGHPAVLWNPPVPFNFTVNINNDTITITGYTGSDGEVTIPGMIDFLPVTSIGDNAFNFNSSLTEVTMSNGISSIGSAAFLYCNQLTNISISDSVTNIGSGAFQWCKALTDVTIPNGVTTFADSVFYDCISLTNITFPPNITSIGEDAFWGCGNLTSFVIPDSVTNIGDGAFSGAGLTSVIIPTGITSIGYITFSSCGNLTNVVIPDGVTNITRWAFSYCPSLSSITIPDSVTSIGYGVFYDCTSLTEVIIGSGITSILQEIFVNCPSLIGVYFMGNAPTIDSLVFTGDTNATIYYSPGTTGWGATFGGLPAVMLPFDFTFSGGTVTITAYTGADGSVIIPDKIGGLPVTTIGDSAFYFTGVTSVTIPDSVTDIGIYAFSRCDGLTNVTIGNGVTNLGMYAFWGDVSLSNVYFRGNAPSYGPNVFVGNHSVTTYIYYLPGTTGWGETFGGWIFGGTVLDAVPTALWLPQIQTSDANFGVQTYQFGFNISWASGQTVVVEASTNLVVWQPVQTNMITTGSAYFSDPQWTNYPGRFYRLRSP